MSVKKQSRIEMISHDGTSMGIVVTEKGGNGVVGGDSAGVK